MKPRVLALCGWAIAVVVATAIGLTAVSLLSKGLNADSVTPLSQDSVATALANHRAQSPDAGTVPPTARPSTPSHSPSTPTRPPTHTRTLDSPGGTVIARCRGDASYLQSWSPAQGWKVDDYDRGPSASTAVSFEGATDATDDHEVAITVTCSSGEPVSHITTSDD